jgi:hypothetical protein
MAKKEGKEAAKDAAKEEVRLLGSGFFLASALLLR